MKALNKKVIIAILSACFVLVASIVAISGIKAAKAEENAFASIESKTFEMEDGVTLKLNEDGGIRFILKMEKDVYDFIKTNDTDNSVSCGFVVAPTSIMSNTSDYLNLSKKYDIQIDEDKIYLEEDGYYANGCIVQMKEANRKIEFAAVGYIKKGSAAMYTAYNGNSRGSLYNTVNETVLLNNDYAKDVLALNSYAWYGVNAEYPVVVSDSSQSENYNALLNEFGNKKAYVSVNSANYNIVMNGATKHNYVLTEDIDMQSSCWDHGTVEFSGTFDGQGHTISNISLNNTGLFYTINNATVKNVAFKNVSVTGSKSFFNHQPGNGGINLANDFTVENVVVDIQSVTSPDASRFAVFGYKIGGVLTINNTVINVNHNITSDMYGFVTTHAHTQQNICNLLCVGSLSLHSTNGNAKLGDNVTINPAYVLKLYKNDGTTEAEAGVDYSVITADSIVVKDTLVSTFYSTMSDEVKALANSNLFATKLQDIMHLTKNNIAEQLLIPTDGYYVLDEDIDMFEFMSWGSSRTAEERKYTNYYFKGTFNGNGHTISNFNVTQTSYNGGLFWSLDGATIKNVVFKNAKITTNNVGLIASRAKNGAKIENVFVELDSVYTTGNGVLSAIEEGIIFNNVAIYVKTVTAGGGTNSAAIAGAYARSIYVSGLYYITDTELNFTPKHNDTKDEIITAIKTLDGKATATENVDYHKMSVAQAKAFSTTALQTDLLKTAFSDVFVETTEE